jgi:cyanophycinase
MSFRHRILIAPASLLLALGVQAAEPTARRGSLVIVGGGERPGPIQERFIQLAGGAAAARIVVIPMASGEPEASGDGQRTEFRSFGATNTAVLRFNREQALDPATSRRLDGVTGVFFTGGDQARLAAVVVGTPFAERLHRLYDEEGAVIGGTSAGAAIMSRIMLTGDQRGEPDRKADFAVIRRGATLTSTGLGFVTNAIVDQHFIARRRENRLLGLVLENPALLGVGIDESTALVVSPDGRWDVVGDGSVMVFDARGSKVSEAAPRQNLGARDLRMHLLLPGDSFDPGAPR